MKGFTGTKSAANYIETEYGTKRFARSVAIDDIPSLLDLLNDFSDFNLKQSKAPEMLKMLIEIKAGINGMSFDQLELLYDDLEQLIQEATTEV